ncbi:hypothetical protein QQ045_033164 [Rhodiola kirilowii]
MNFKFICAASTQDSTGKAIHDYDMKHATPFSYDAGHINPNRVMDPGLIYDLTINDYLNFLCTSGYDQNKLKLFMGEGAQFQCPQSFSLLAFNYPSISAMNISGTHRKPTMWDHRGLIELRWRSRLEFWSRLSRLG